MQQKCKQAVHDIDSGTDSPSYASGVCIGFVSGVLESHTLWMVVDAAQKRTHPTSFCIPDEVTETQILRVFLKYLDEHPEKLHYPAVVMLIESVRHAFPCKN